MTDQLSHDDETLAALREEAQSAAEGWRFTARDVMRLGQGTLAVMDALSAAEQERDELAARLAASEAEVARLRAGIVALHPRGETWADLGATGGYRIADACQTCQVEWPCPTVHVLTVEWAAREEEPAAQPEPATPRPGPVADARASAGNLRPMSDPYRRQAHVQPEARPCPVCGPVGRVRQDPDGFLSCSNCLWNTEEDACPWNTGEPAAQPEAREEQDEARCGARVPTPHPRISQECVLPPAHNGEHAARPDAPIAEEPRRG